MSKKFKVDKNNLKRGTKKKKSSSMPGIILVLGIGAGIFLSCKNYIPSSTKENSQHTAQKATPAAAQDSPEKSAKTEIAKPKVRPGEDSKVVFTLLYFGFFFQFFPTQSVCKCPL